MELYKLIAEEIREYLEQRSVAVDITDNALETGLIITWHQDDRDNEDSHGQVQLFTDHAVYLRKGYFSSRSQHFLYDDPRFPDNLFFKIQNRILMIEMNKLALILQQELGGELIGDMSNKGYRILRFTGSIDLIISSSDLTKVQVRHCYYTTYTNVFELNDPNSIEKIKQDLMDP
jgi:hypothetical protein